MIKIYSNVDSRLMHIVVRSSDFSPPRVDVSEDSQYLQCALLNLNKGKTFKPHKHNIRNYNTDKFIAQESWCVVSGKVEVFFYDLNDKLLCSHILNAGDASMTFFGGHNYLILEDNTLVYEYKTGPYMGQTIDKTFI